MRSAFYLIAGVLFAVAPLTAGCAPKATHRGSCDRPVSLSFPPLLAPMAESHLPPMPASPTPAPCNVIRARIPHSSKQK
jgi:hypothetical protein